MESHTTPTKEEIQDARIASLEHRIEDMDADYAEKVRTLTKRVNERVEGESDASRGD